MAKKKKSKFKTFSLAAVLFGILAIACYFFTFVEGSITILSQKGTASFNGFHLAFGTEEGKFSVEGIISATSNTAVCKQSTTGLLGFIFTIGGILLSAFIVLVPKKFTKLASLLATAAFVACAVFAFTSLNGYATANSVDLSKVGDLYKLGFGAIAVGVLNSLAAFGNVLTFLGK